MRCLLCALTALSFAAPSLTHAASAGAKAPVLADTHANPSPADPPGEWHRAARDYAGTRFSELNQITADNVSSLHIAWTFSDGTVNGHEAAPLTGC